MLKHENKFLLAKAIFVSQAIIAWNTRIWFVSSSVIVALGANLSVSFGVVIIVQHYNIRLHYSFYLMSYCHAFSVGWCFVAELLYLCWLIISSSVVNSITNGQLTAVPRGRYLAGEEVLNVATLGFDGCYRYARWSLWWRCKTGRHAPRYP